MRTALTLLLAAAAAAAVAAAAPRSRSSSSPSSPSSSSFSAAAGGGSAPAAAEAPPSSRRRASGERGAPAPAFRLGAPLSAARCPFPLDDWRADEHSRLVTALVPEGHIEEAFACSKRIMADVREGAVEVTQDQRRDLEFNDEVLRVLVSPRQPGKRRVYHNVFGLDSGIPANSSDPLPPPPARDPAIVVVDDVLSRAQCEALVSIFEASEHFEGNLYSDGQVKVNHAFKKAREFDISATAHTDAAWAAVDRLLLSALTRLLAEYEARVPVVRTLKNPLDDEGFRMKRYLNDGTEHHHYHADSGQEPLGAPRRIIAFLLYVNDVEVGGETVFLNQGVAVKPRCGRALLFPTAFTYVHAGRRPVSGPKYVVADFITLSSGTG